MRVRPLVPEWLLPTCSGAFETHMKQIQELDAGVLAQILRGARLSNFPPREEFKKLTMPALILAWVDDATHPVSTSEELKDLLPNSQLVIAGGMSMGCATAVSAALAAPERIIGLVLVTPPTAWETRAAQGAIYDFLADTVEAKGAAALQDLMRVRPLVPEWLLPTCSGAFEAHMKQIQELDAGVLTQILRGARLCNFPPRDEFKKLTMPALILAWVDDATHPVSTSEELNALLPGSQLVIAKEVDDVKTWPGLIREFISKLSC